VNGQDSDWEKEDGMDEKKDLWNWIKASDFTVAKKEAAWINVTSNMFLNMFQMFACSNSVKFSLRRQSSRK
jgi:hypothetical protein